ncbi:MAG: S8 family serine peptidase [Flavobacteriaceae bacterium]|nr:S8 family serine peptidase [Flavobacteriaceae bacterium]
MSIVFIMSFGVMQAQKSIIIKFKENNYTSYNGKYQSGNENFDNLINNSGHKHNPIGNFAKTKTLVVNLNPDDFLDFYINEYKKLENVDFVEEDFIAKGAGISNLESNSFNPISTFPNDTFFNRQWGLYNDGTMSGIGSVVADSDTDMELAWDIETGDPNMIIAVPDTGFRMTHPELAGRIWNNPNDPIDGIDNDGNGLIDDYQGWDYVNNDNDPTDDYGHGSNCSGIILAKANNGIGYAGVNWNSKLMVLKVLNQNNSGTYSAMANSIYYAVDNGAKVISMSIGGTTFSQALKDAVDYAYNHNVVFVACMMNDNNNAVYYPAGHDNVISVGSTNANDYRTNPFSWGGGSNYGNHIDVVAPGNYIYGLSHTSDTNYNTYWGGTSQATPLVAGIISLMLSKNPTLSVDQIRDIIRDSADDMVGNPAEDTAGFDIYMGYGRANAFKALQDVPVLNITETADISNIQITNPIKESLIIRSSKELGNTKIIIYSLEGKQIFETAANIKQGINETNLSNIPKGNYILEFNNKNYRKSFKIIKH